MTAPEIGHRASGSFAPRVNEPAAVLLASDLLRWFIPHVGKFPRQIRFGLGSRLESAMTVAGSAADTIKRAMIDLERRLCASPPAGRMLLQVHDELVLEPPLAELEATRDLARECMEVAANLSVPLRVDLGHGRTWLDAH